MTIYVDSVSTWSDSTRDWSFLWSDSDDAELDAFAEKIGLCKENAIVSHAKIVKRLYHHRISADCREQALQAGATHLQMFDYIRGVYEGRR